MSLKRDILRWLASNEGRTSIASRKCARYPRGYVSTGDIRGYGSNHNRVRYELREMGFIQYDLEVLVPSAGLSMTDVMREWITCDYARTLINEQGYITITDVMGSYHGQTTVELEIDLAFQELGWTKTAKGYVPQ